MYEHGWGTPEMMKGEIITSQWSQWFFESRCALSYSCSQEMSMFVNFTDFTIAKDQS